MIKINALNGHDENIVDRFNKLSQTLPDGEILDLIVNSWVDDEDLDSISDLIAERTKMKLTITKGNFLSWYLDSGQDQENEEIKKGILSTIIHQLTNVGHASISVNELFDNCTQESIRLSFINEFIQDDIYQPLNRECSDIELGELNNYELILID